MGNLALSAQLAVPVGMRPADGDSTIPWYMLVGAPVAAYQPKGAASQAASYINVANPGVHDLTVGNAPAWAANTGWTFTRASSHYLISDIVPATNYTAIVQFSGIPSNGVAYVVLGCSQESPDRYFGLLADNSGGATVYQAGGMLGVAPNSTSGNLAVAGQKGYRNGIADAGTIPNGNGFPTIGLYIGTRNSSGGPQAATYLTGTIVAIAIYSFTLSAGQIATMATAMAAL